MSKGCMNYYKMCREAVGFTQNQAAERINVSVRQLSDYENDKAKVPEDVVDAMANIYNAPMLAWWHLKHFSRLGKYLPDVVEPKTNCDMAFLSILAADDLDEANDIIKDVLSDGEISSDEMAEVSRYKSLMKKVGDRVMSVNIYANSEL